MYLTYIIDHYDELPDRMVFMHPHRSSWHIEDAVAVLKKMRWDAHEYANLRCNWTAHSGCPEGMVSARTAAR